jgi:hypothetical protein
MVHVATKTLAAIDAAIEADQGAAYRVHLGTVLPHMGDAYRGVEINPFRKHLGASLLGQECGRAIWYGFRWARRPRFPGRVLRLFNRGHLEEARFIACLLTIGVQVWQQDENGKQFRISDVGGHLGGSGDGVCMGVPDLAPDTPCLLEFKTHNDASFKKLLAQGVRGAKLEHYVQMNIYMRKMGLPIALYGAVNKNDDSLYMELVMLDTSMADQFLERGKTIILSQVPPKRISESPGWFACKWCDHRPTCHKLGGRMEANCRTCKYSKPNPADGQWYCENVVVRAASVTTNQHGHPLTEGEQLAGCSHYEAIDGN